MTKPVSAADELFWDCASLLYSIEGLRESTMFGFRCLRIGNQFVGMPAQDRLWVKLPEERVACLIDSEVGEVCAPNGRRFREWVQIAQLDEDLWMSLLRESIDFVRASRVR